MFNFTGLSNLALPQNGPHQFAVRHSLCIYNLDSIYTLIPKNGCSTMRLSIALQNGVIEESTQANWIHKNNQSFMPNMEQLVKAKYKFVILRCPFRRLASVFLDKFVSKEIQAWHYRDSMQRRVNLDELTFESFVKSLQTVSILTSDIHWRPQVQFLVYQNYNDYFSLENFQFAISTLKEKIGLDIVDARSITQHGLEKFNQLNNENHSKTPAFDISVLKRQGSCPSYSSMYTPELVNIVRKLYAKDLSLYSEKFGTSNLLF